MKKITLLILLFTILAFTSCKTLTITKDHEKIDGIPFYAHKAVVEQETKYLYDWIVISLLREEVKENNKVITAPLLTVRVTSEQNIDSIKRAVDNLKLRSLKQDLKTVIDDIRSIEVVTLHADSIETDDVIENSWTIQTKVDYTTKYYLNSKMPWFGTSTLSQKLASNGTLSEAAATTDSQIDELAGVVAGLATPISSIRIAEIEKEDRSSPAEKELFEMATDKGWDSKIIDILQQNISKDFITYKLLTEEKGFIYTFKKTHEFEDREKANEPIKFCLRDGNYSRENWPQETKKVKNKDEKPTINVSGSIQLPEGKEKSVD